ncbi:LEA domain protein [Sarocladium implicatum]|nr:LEA domain protein [Sarocladium implicatum]
MYADISKPPPPLPSPSLQQLSGGLTLLPPLSRRGTGPGLIILTPPDSTDKSCTITERSPSPLAKWAEESYSVVQIPEESLTSGEVTISQALLVAVQGLEQSGTTAGAEKIGLIAYSPRLWDQVAPVLPQHPAISACVVYIDQADKGSISSCDVPLLRHVVGARQSSRDDQQNVTDYYYPDVKSIKFCSPEHEDFHYNTDSVAHTRNLQFLKPRMNGPFFDLEKIWDEHTYYEFADRSVEHTMSTMVQEPYVNHVPTLTGGIGRAKLTDFYRHNFIFNNSADTELELISRTIGIDRVIDEFIYKFTHDREIDWLLPGIPATHLKAEIPFTAVVNIRGDRLYHEHISWDQGTALRQLRLMPEYLPFDHPHPEGKTGRWEYKVPVTGVDTAQKMRDRNSVQSNQMFEYKIRPSIQEPAAGSIKGLSKEFGVREVEDATKA